MSSSSTSALRRALVRCRFAPLGAGASLRAAATPLRLRPRADTAPAAVLALPGDALPLLHLLREPGLVALSRGDWK